MVGIAVVKLIRGECFNEVVKWFALAGAIKFQL